MLTAQVTKLELPDATPAGRSESHNIALLLEQAFNLPVAETFADYSGALMLSPSDEAEALEKMGMKHGTWLGMCPFAGTRQRTPPVKRWQRFLPKALKLDRFDRLLSLWNSGGLRKAGRAPPLRGTS